MHSHKIAMYGVALAMVGLVIVVATAGLQDDPENMLGWFRPLGFIALIGGGAIFVLGMIIGRRG